MSVGNAPRWRQNSSHVILIGCRVILTPSVLVALYYLLPLDRRPDVPTAAGLVVTSVLFLALGAWEVRAILNSAHPAVRAIEGVLFALPLFVLLFASTYYLMGRAGSSNFTEAMSRTDALYFTMTIFTTVGFGDITAKGELARIVVTLQMVLDFIILGVGIRIILGAVQRGRERTQQGSSADEQSP